ncbi:MAG: hypothetical protein K2V38_03255, partial [Gemmataceae bacterium]|nr:hypothetical protein [Gemmataceae bacterium]
MSSVKKLAGTPFVSEPLFRNLCFGTEGEKKNREVGAAGVFTRRRPATSRLRDQAILQAERVMGLEPTTTS